VSLEVRDALRFVVECYSRGLFDRTRADGVTLDRLAEAFDILARAASGNVPGDRPIDPPQTVEQSEEVRDMRFSVAIYNAEALEANWYRSADWYKSAKPSFFIQLYAPGKGDLVLAFRSSETAADWWRRIADTLRSYVSAQGR
jgi:hypothetical protein